VRALFDVNVLIAMLQPAHVHFESAHRWWDENQTYGWASCPLTENGFVRIVSQAKYPAQIAVAGAIEQLAAQYTHTDHAFWPDDISLLDAESFDRGRILGPKQLTDIYLLGLAVKRGGRLATFDRAIPLAAVKAATARNLAVIPVV
jgi:toxin-antitoxin system PIN domain toxin